VGSLLNKIETARLSNLRLIQHDAAEVVKNMIPRDSLAAVHIFFPDPWPKKRHHKRRLIQAEFVSLLCKRLKKGGYLHVATDWKDYAEHILSVLGNEPQLANTAHDYAQRPEYRPLTKFEQRGLKLGNPVWDIVFRKRGD
ncbi:MAG TPA: tRNA (guanosine(46)-N7)-methyltransferase TrmB, partial [Burkholderiales bacterium]|nr:tRNA (guanosine(46)-N7)-methyltransferase TrmB [Burkholderiales bacterium]